MGVLNPLSQTNFFPDLIHVKVLSETMEVEPAVLQAVPVLIEGNAGNTEALIEVMKIKENITDRLPIFIVKLNLNT
jgi:hypothetical protein